MKRLVSYSTNGTTSALAKRTLRLLREDVPRRILPCVPSWKEAEVQMWLQQIGFSQYCRRFCVRPAELSPLGREPAQPRGRTAARGALHKGDCDWSRPARPRLQGGLLGVECLYSATFMVTQL